MTDGNEPVFEDGLFGRKRKNGRWEVVEAPVLPAGVSVADTHAHVHMLPDPAFALFAAALHGVRFVELITDPAEDGSVVFDGMDSWTEEARGRLRQMPLAVGSSAGGAGDAAGADTAAAGLAGDAPLAPPHLRVAVGVHPHNASAYDDAMEARLAHLLQDSRVSAVGEIGLDYHYDLSPREVQREVFRRQIRVAKAAGLPVVLHLREAHDDGFRILAEEDFPPAGTLLHCFNLDAAELARWVKADCHVAFGGPLTFKRADEVREAARLVPPDRLLTETDAPYMTPEPLRGQTCTPAHVVWTAERLCEARGCETPAARRALLEQAYETALALLNRPR